MVWKSNFERTMEGDHTKQKEDLKFAKSSVPEIPEPYSGGDSGGKIEGPPSVHR